MDVTQGCLYSAPTHQHGRSPHSGPEQWQRHSAERSSVAGERGAARSLSVSGGGEREEGGEVAIRKLGEGAGWSTATLGTPRRLKTGGARQVR